MVGNDTHDICDRGMTYEKIMSNIIGDIMRSMEPPHKNRQQQQNTTITLAYSMPVDHTRCSGSDMYHGILKTYNLFIDFQRKKKKLQMEEIHQLTNTSERSRKKSPKKVLLDFVIGSLLVNLGRMFKCCYVRYYSNYFTSNR